MIEPTSQHHQEDASQSERDCEKSRFEAEETMEWRLWLAGSHSLISIADE